MFAFLSKLIVKNSPEGGHEAYIRNKYYGSVTLKSEESKVFFLCKLNILTAVSL